LDKTAKTKLVNDIENRLDDFFGEQTESAPSRTTGPSLEKLKSAVLSIDWEITDACLSDLIGEIEALLPRFENDRLSHALLRMLRGLGRYIRKRKAQAHQDAIRCVMSAFASLETLVQDRRMGRARKRRIVAKEILAFKKLKEQVETQRAARKKALTPPAGGSRGPSGVAALLEHEGFKEAMLAVEERFNRQVAALKAELASLQQELKTLRKGS
jgi:hypothetical protein